MEMDPVVLLAEQLRTAERTLHTAVRSYELDRCQENGETVNSLLCSIKGLHRELTQTVPTSALGASELVRLAAQRLPFSLARSALVGAVWVKSRCRLLIETSKELTVSPFSWHRSTS